MQVPDVQQRCHLAHPLLAQVGLDDLRVPLDLLGRTLSDDPAVVEHTDDLTDPHHKTHVMLYQKDRDLKLVADLLDVAHELLGLVGVHAGSRFVEQQHLGMGCQSPQDLEPTLGAVGEPACPLGCELAHAKDVEQLEGPLVELPLLPPVLRQTQHVRQKVRRHRVREAHEHVFLHRHLVEEADVLEGARDAHLVDLHHAEARRVVAVDQDGATRGCVDVGQQVEDGGLAGAVGPDEARDLRAAHGDVEVVDGNQAAEVDAKVLGLQDGDGAQIALGDEVGRLHLDEDGALPLALAVRHRRPPPPQTPSSRGASRS